MDFLSLNKDQLFEIVDLLEIEIVPENGKKATKDELIAACVEYEAAKPEEMKAALHTIGVEIKEEKDEEEPKQEPVKEQPPAKDEKIEEPKAGRHLLQSLLEAPKDFGLDFRGKQLFAKNKLIEIVATGQKIEGLDLSGLDLSGLVLNGVSLKGCTFNKTKVDEAQFQGCDFTDAKIIDTNFDKADIRWSVGLVKLNHMGQKVD